MDIMKEVRLKSKINSQNVRKMKFQPWKSNLNLVKETGVAGDLQILNDLDKNMEDNK